MVRKADVKVGEAYACGGTSQYDFRVYERGVVVEVDGERTSTNRWDRDEVVRGIVVQFERDAPMTRLPQARRVKGDRSVVVLRSGTALRMTWAEYEREKVARAKADEADKLRDAERVAECESLQGALRGAFGVNIRVDTDRRSYRKVWMDPKAAQEMLEKAAPADVAGGAVEMFVEELQRNGMAIVPANVLAERSYETVAAAAVSEAKRAAVDATVAGIAAKDAGAA